MALSTPASATSDGLVAAAAPVVAARGSSLGRDAFRRLRRNRLAMAGAVVVSSAPSGAAAGVEAVGVLTVGESSSAGESSTNASTSTTTVATTTPTRAPLLIRAA